MGQMKVWIEMLQLASRLNLKYLRRFIFLLFLPHFCFPWGRPWGNHAVVWIEREFDGYNLSRSMYPSIFNSFPVIRTASAKNRRFYVPQPTFLFPLDYASRSKNGLYAIGTHCICLRISATFLAESRLPVTIRGSSSTASSWRAAKQQMITFLHRILLW